MPVVYDNLSRGHAGAVLWGPLIKGDIRDQDLLQKSILRNEVGAVIHFAALAYVGESVERPDRYYDNNVGGMLCVLNAVKQTSVQAMVFSSSCATYGAPETVPITEGTSQSPINPYGRTKLICEWMLKDFATAHGFRYAALRYFNAAGADPDQEIGEHHDPETHIIPLALRAALRNGPPLRIFGTDYPTPDGTCIRDYVHVDDLARAHVLALDAVYNGNKCLQLNLGTGNGTSVKQIVQSVSRVTGREVPVEFTSRRPGDPQELVASVKKAWDVLGFKTKWNDIDEIVGHAAPWFATGNGEEEPL